MKKLASLVFLAVVASACRGSTLSPGKIGPGGGNQIPLSSGPSFFVSPSGSDSNPGTEGQPFRSVERAKAAVRSINGDMSEDIYVYLRGGTHELSATVDFGSGDSGSNGHSVVYTSYPGERATLSGGRAIGGWRDAGNGIYQASVGSLTFRQLYVNGAPAIRARSPNVGSFYRLRGWDEAGQAVVIDPGEIASWDNLNEVEMVITKEWEQDRLRIGSYSVSGGEAAVAPMEPERSRFFTYDWSPLRIPNLTYFMENALELLDSPGEWYLNPHTGTLYYKPRAGEDLSSASVVAPELEQLIDVRGSPGAPVRNIRFERLALQHTTWRQPSESGFADYQADAEVGTYKTAIGASIRVQYAEGIVFARNIFKNLGSIGLGFVSGVHGSRVIGNHFEDISASAINVDMKLDPFPSDSELCRDDVISNNRVTRAAQDYPSSIGIFAGYVRNLTLEHNELFDLPYSGISVGWGWSTDDSAAGDNQIRYNDIHDVMKVMSDGAGIYMLSKQPGTLLLNNYLHDIWKRSPWQAGTNGPAYGIYLDEGSSAMRVEDNALENVELSFFIHIAPNNTLVNLYGDVLDYSPELNTYLSTGTLDIAAVKANAGIETAYQDIDGGGDEGGGTGGGGGGGGGGATCSGTNSVGTHVTVPAGQAVCGDDFRTWTCAPSGWQGPGDACSTAEHAPAPNPGQPAVTCSGDDNHGIHVTVSAGAQLCGDDSQLWSCDASTRNWVAMHTPC